MRWLCCLLVSTAAAQSGGGSKPLRFDIPAIAETRDSFAFFVRGAERGHAVWQYRRTAQGSRQTVDFTAVSVLEPVETESLHVAINRLTGAPIASFHRIDLLAPGSDTVLVEHDLAVNQREVAGRRRVRTRDGAIKIIPVHVPLPGGVVWSDYALLAAHVLAAEPGDTLTGPAYSEFGDSLFTLVVVAEAPRTITVPAGRFEVVPLRTTSFRVYVSRVAPRRVVKGESLDGLFTFELAGTGPVVPSGR
jgi:hypothetical protein